MRVCVYTTLVILNIIYQVFPWTLINLSIGITAIIALIWSLFYARGLYLITGVVFLMAGLFLFLLNDFPWYTFFFHFERMLGLLSLFLTLPFINSLISVGRYDKNLSLLLENKIAGLSQLYRRSFAVCHFLTLFLNIATIPLLLKSLSVTLGQLPQKTANNFYSRNLLRAYALCLAWSPMEVMVLISIDLTKVKYYQVLPALIFIVLIMVLLDWSISHFKFKAVQLSLGTDSEISFKKVYKKASQMLVMLFIFVLVASLVQHFLNKSFLFSVVLLMIPFSVMWAAVIRKTKRYFVVTLPYWRERTEGLASYFFMFLSAGLFVDMLAAAGMVSVLEPIFSVASGYRFLFYLTVGGYFLVTSIIGFHPLVSLTFLAEILKPILPHMAPVPTTVVLITCSLATVMYSPYNLSVSILADQLRLNPYKITLWNIGFAVLYILISISIAYVIGIRI